LMEGRPVVSWERRVFAIGVRQTVTLALAAAFQERIGFHICEELTPWLRTSARKSARRSMVIFTEKAA